MNLEDVQVTVGATSVKIGAVELGDLDVRSLLQHLLQGKAQDTPSESAADEDQETEKQDGAGNDQQEVLGALRWMNLAEYRFGLLQTLKDLLDIADSAPMEDIEKEVRRVLGENISLRRSLKEIETAKKRKTEPVQSHSAMEVATWKGTAKTIEVMEYLLIVLEGICSLNVPTEVEMAFIRDSFPNDTDFKVIGRCLRSLSSRGAIDLERRRVGGAHGRVIYTITLLHPVEEILTSINRGKTHA